MPLYPYSLQSIFEQLKLTIEQKRHIAMGIIRGVVAGHSVGFEHKDLKPANIMLTKELVPKVCDWGLCKFDGQIGTQRYMAPELFNLEINKIDAKKVDSWGLGLTLYYLVEEKDAFSDNDIDKI